MFLASVQSLTILMCPSWHDLCLFHILASLQDSSTSGVVLEDFDADFTNRFYHSHLDDQRETH